MFYKNNWQHNFALSGGGGLYSSGNPYLKMFCLSKLSVARALWKKNIKKSSFTISRKTFVTASTKIMFFLIKQIFLLPLTETILDIIFFWDILDPHTNHVK